MVNGLFKVVAFTILLAFVLCGLTVIGVLR